VEKLEAQAVLCKLDEAMQAKRDELSIMQQQLQASEAEANAIQQVRAGFLWEGEGRGSSWADLAPALTLLRWTGHQRGIQAASHGGQRPPE
jgi:hypothetical protein